MANAPNVAKCEFIYNWNGEVCENVFHVRNGSAWTLESLNDLGTILAQWWLDDMSGLQASSVTLNKIVITDLTTPTSSMIEFTDGLPDTGSGSGSVSNNVTIAVKLLTASRGRSYRGRFYHVGLFAGQLDDINHISSLTAAELVQAVDDLLAALAVGGFEWVVTSYFTGGAERSTAVSTAITGASVNLTIDSQRRRLPERGT